MGGGWRVGVLDEIKAISAPSWDWAWAWAELGKTKVYILLNRTRYREKHNNYEN